MNQQDFILRFAVDGHELAAIERALEERCRDALIGIGAPGRIALYFTREAESVEAAMLSAIEDVQQALPGARLLHAQRRVGPQLQPFPEFSSHEQATRFKCEEPLGGEAKPSGFGAGRGQYVQTCQCGYRTWYDLTVADNVAAA